jgi:hypothetical protein
MLRNFAPGADSSPRVLIRDDQFYGGYVSLAGRYAAVVAPTMSCGTSIRVIDRDSGQTVYQLQPSLDMAPGSLSLQDDGTVAFIATAAEANPSICGSPPRVAVESASIADPQPHRVPGLIPVPGTTIRLARNRLALSNTVDIKQSIDRRQDFPIYDLAGSKLGQMSAWQLFENFGAWDFNGAQLVAAVRPCSVSTIAIWDTSQPPPSSQGTGCNRLILRGRIIALDVKSRRFSITGSCPTATPAGCGGYIGIYRPPLRRKQALTGFAYSLRPGETHVWHPPLFEARNLALLRRDATKRLTISVISGGYDQDTRTVALKLRARRQSSQRPGHGSRRPLVATWRDL